MQNRHNLLIITGPSATGKTKLGLELAREFNGEIISADSRQVYKYMDIGTGKDLPVNFKFQISNFKLKGTHSRMNYGYYLFDSVPVWGLDIVEPDYWFNVVDWVDYATLVIRDIRNRGKLPIVVGGTGQYIRSLLIPPETINIPIDLKLRNQLINKSVTKLQTQLLEIDGNKWERMNESDRKNPRRLIRAIEVGERVQNSNCALCAEFLRSRNNFKVQIENYQTLVIGLTAPREMINQRIDKRVEDRIRQGMIEEVRRLLDKGYSWDLPSMSGIGYKEFRKEGVKENWKIAEHQYAKRQLTYLRKYLPQAVWFDVTSENFEEEIRNKVHSLINYA